MARNDRPDDERLAKIIRAVGAIVFAVICFGFRNDDPSTQLCCTHKNKIGRDIDVTKKLLNADFAGSSDLKMAPPQQITPPPVPGIPAVKK